MNIKNLPLSLAAILLLCMGCGGSALAATNAERPNIVVILTDDLGYGSVGCNGAPTDLVKTPHIDRLAREGLRFTDANTPSSVCSPTRYGLLTGRYSWRTPKKWGVVDALDPLQIETSRPTVASLLKQAGYTTGIVGKWHLGFGTKQRAETDFSSPFTPGPLQVGFDFYFGLPQNHGDIWGVYMDNETVWGLRSTNHLAPSRPFYYGGQFLGFDAPLRDDWTAQSVLTDRAVSWIKQQTPAKPFFLYFASAAIHEPITPSKESQGASGIGPYGDFIQDVDISVGRIMEALEESGFGENTLVIFTSDNGGNRVVSEPKGALEPPAPYVNFEKCLWEAWQKGFRANGEFRDQKSSIYQGGFRVPFIVRWPGHVPAKAESDQMICLVDMMATLADLVDIPLPDPQTGCEDSFSFLPALLGKTVNGSYRDAVVLQSTDGMYAVRKGQWKWIEGIQAKGIPKSHQVLWGKPQGAEELYDLSKDPAEKNNVIREHPEVASMLRDILNRTRDQGRSRIGHPSPPAAETMRHAKSNAGSQKNGDSK